MQADQNALSRALCVSMSTVPMELASADSHLLYPTLALVTLFWVKVMSQGNLHLQPQTVSAGLPQVAVTD